MPRKIEYSERSLEQIEGVVVLAVFILLDELHESCQYCFLNVEWSLQYVIVTMTMVKVPFTYEDVVSYYLEQFIIKSMVC